jgi:AbrB family looped-hinge helix DNA binding protein
MVNKILRVGDSAAITIPKSVLREMGLSIGDKMVVTYLPQENEIVIRPLLTGGTLISDRVARLTTHFIDRYRGALKRLAQ